METRTNLSTILQDYFYQRLINQRDFSQKTILSYRDTFRLLFDFVENKRKIRIDKFQLTDINADLVLQFLDYLEKERGNKIQTRNARLATIHSFMQYALLKEPTVMKTIQQVLSIPLKRFDRPLLGSLSREEMNAIINAPDQASWSNHRDRVLFATLYNTGARVSEIINIRISDLSLEYTKSLLLHGKGRKERTIPLWNNTVGLIKNWLKRIDSAGADVLFPNRYGNKLTRSGVENRLKTAINIAITKCPSLKNKQISPHTIRHTTAMHLLQSGVDLTVIALWLGHESVNTTHHYVEADMLMKEKALSNLTEPHVKIPRFKSNTKILAFLDSL